MNTTEDHQHQQWQWRPLPPLTMNVANTRYVNDTKNRKDHTSADTTKTWAPWACEHHDHMKHEHAMVTPQTDASAGNQHCECSDTDDHQQSWQEGRHTYGQPHKYSTPPIAQCQQSIWCVDIWLTPNKDDSDCWWGWIDVHVWGCEGGDTKVRMGCRWRWRSPSTRGCLEDFPSFLLCIIVSVVM